MATISPEVIKEIARAQRRFLLFFSVLSIAAIPLVYYFFPYLPWESNRDIAIFSLLILAAFILLNRLLPKRYAYSIEISEILASIAVIFVFAAASGYIKSPANVMYLVAVIFSFFVVGRRFGFAILALLFVLLSVETLIPAWHELIRGNARALFFELSFFFFYFVAMSYVIAILLFLSEVLKRIEQKRVRAEEAAKHFREMVKILRELDKEKTQFIRLVAHHFRTPLSRIKWALDLLQEGELGTLSAKQKKVVEESRKTNEDLIALLYQILDISKWELGQAHVDKEILYSEIARDRAEFWSSKAKEKNIAMEAEIPEGIMIQGNKDGLATVLDAVLDNAVLYTKEGGSITITVSRNSEGVETLIQDSGAGIPFEEQKLLFSAFFRGSNVKSRNGIRKGMGLYVSQKIVRAHEGTIRVESEEGKGTRVSIFLPYQQKLKGRVEQYEESKENAAKGCRI